MATPEHDSSKGLVGIVIVSHSRTLARAAVELAAEMLHGRPVPIAVAAGLDEVTLGTDAVRIKEAIQEVDSPAGVVVLMDLGSAVFSAELALDLIDDPEVRERVVLSPAPHVEGLVAAAVAAAGGAGRREVAAEAQSALLGKDAHLSNPEDGQWFVPTHVQGAEAIPVLLGLGVRELSVSPRSVPSVKARVRTLDLVRCAALAGMAIDLDNAAAVRRLVSSLLEGDDDVTPVPAASDER